MYSFKISIRVADNSNDFTELFLRSHYFDQAGLYRIARHLKIDGKYETKENLSAKIAQRLNLARMTEQDMSIILRELVKRSRRYITFKTGTVSKFPQCSNPMDLIYSRGKKQWYGPIRLLDDDANWYLHPFFFKYIERSEDIEGNAHEEEFVIRWLCFARATRDTLSLHWTNFGVTGEGVMYIKNAPQSGSLSYWDYIPELMKDFEDMTQSTVIEPRLDELILDNLWERYRYDDGYIWEDERIRAEHRGVALNASGMGGRNDADGVDIDVVGIDYLATTIRKSIALHLKNNHNYTLPEPDRFDEEILRTLIKEYNPKSYQCLISTVEPEAEVMFRAHTYFGKKPESNSADSFPHLHLKNISNSDDIDCVKFLTQHLSLIRSGDTPYGNSEDTQKRLF